MTIDEKRSALAAAIAARQVIAQLPDGLRQWAQQYEQALIEDLNAVPVEQAYDAAADRARDSPKPWLTTAMQIIGPIVVDTIKKHWPTASVATALSLLTNLASNYLLKQ